jgi:hypothetical protein
MWRCITIIKGCKPVKLAPAVLAAALAAYPVPARNCVTEIRCHWVLPPELFRPGGEFYQPPSVLPPIERVPVLEWPMDAAPVVDVPAPGGMFLVALLGLWVVMRVWGDKTRKALDTNRAAKRAHGVV